VAASRSKNAASSYATIPTSSEGSSTSSDRVTEVIASPVTAFLAANRIVGRGQEEKSSFRSATGGAGPDSRPARKKIRRPA